MPLFQVQDLQGRYELEVFRFAEDFSEDPATFLSPIELQELSLMTSEKRRTEFLQVRWRVKRGLQLRRGTTSPKVTLTEMGFTKIGEGKPVWAGSEWDFNISHSGDVFAIAYSMMGQVGVDIEKIREPQNADKISAKFFSPQEIAVLSEAKPDSEKALMFAKLWSGKEALIKAVGGGVFQHVREVQIDASELKTPRIASLPSSYGDLSRWTLQFYQPIDDYMCAVALKNKGAF